jgi:hypothetical protein
MAFRSGANIFSSFLGEEIGAFFPQEIQGKFSLQEVIFSGTVAGFLSDTRALKEIDTRELIKDLVSIKLGISAEEIQEVKRIREIKNRFRVSRTSLGISFSVALLTKIGGAYRQISSLF